MDIAARTIYIENFPLNTTEITLKKLFQNFGHIKQIDVPTFDAQHPICRGLPRPKSKGYATIEFMKQESAEKAIQFFNDLDYIVNVTQGKPCPDRRSDQGDIQDLDALRNKIIQNLEYKNLLLLRVMSYTTYQNLTKRYKEQKLQSLVRAAKMLVIGVQ